MNLIRSVFTLGFGALFYSATGELWLLTAALFTETLSLVVLQGIAGSIIDRIGTKQVYLKCMSLFFMVMFGVSILDFSMVEFSTVENVIALFAIFTLFNLLIPFTRTATFVTLKRLTPTNELEKVNGKLVVALQVGQILGMAAVGLCVQWQQESLLIYLVAVASISALLLYRRLPDHLLSPVAEHTFEGHLVKQFVDSFRQVFELMKLHPVLISLSVLSIVDLALIAVFNLLLAPAVERLFVGDGIWLAWLGMTFSIGCVLGAQLIVGKRRSVQARISVTLLSVFTSVLVFACFVYSASTIVVLECVFLFGFFAGISNVVWNAQLQKVTPSHMMGRLTSLRFIWAAFVITLMTVVVSKGNEISFFNAGMSAIAMAVLLGVICVYLYFTRVARTTTEEISRSSL